jgi:hypothetical protein
LAPDEARKLINDEDGGPSVNQGIPRPHFVDIINGCVDANRNGLCGNDTAAGIQLFDLP